MLRRTLLITLLAVSSMALSQDKVLDPSGSYNMETRGFELEGGVFVGRLGGLNVQLIGTDSIAIALSVNRGWPSYNMGSLEDTIPYDGYKASCYTMEDSACTITLEFSMEAIHVEQYQPDLSQSCGFGSGVYVNGVYRKKHANRPIEHWWDTLKVDCTEPLSKLSGEWSSEDMALLMNSFHPACLNNVEYREWSNELFFQALDMRPELFIEALEHAEESWQVPFVLHELANPVLDLPDPAAIKAKVIATQVKEDWLKKRVIAALDGNFD